MERGCEIPDEDILDRMISGRHQIDGMLEAHNDTVDAILAMVGNVVGYECMQQRTEVEDELVELIRHCQNKTWWLVEQHHGKWPVWLE